VWLTSLSEPLHMEPVADDDPPPKERAVLPRSAKPKGKKP
jgi:hypothetical protein